MSNFNIGDFIRFKYTGDRAEILEDYMDGSYRVWLESDQDESIAFADDIVLEANFKGIEQSSFFKAKPKKEKTLSTEEMFYSKKELDSKRWEKLRAPLEKLNKSPQSSKKKRIPEVEQPTFVQPAIKETQANNAGLFVAFLQTDFGRYTIYLVNDTLHSFSFEFKLHLNNQEHHQLRHQITPQTFFPIGDLEQAQLNDHPNIELNVPVLNLAKKQKIRTKQFLRGTTEIPLMGTEGFVFPFSLPKQIQKKEDLQAYTQKQIKHNAPPKSSKKKPKKHYDIDKIANFKTEIDLHIDRLAEDREKILPTRILGVQLKHFEKYIQDAVNVGVNRVFVIHGVGEGKLKNAIHLYLKHNKHVASYSNQYHHKYGFGATEVIFKSR